MKVHPRTTTFKNSYEDKNSYEELFRKSREASRRKESEDQMEFEMVIQDPTEMKKLARKLLENFTPPVVFILIGDLGAGKTTLVKACAEELGTEARSPSFSIMNEYRTSHPLIKKIIHMDLYRLNGTEDVELLDPDYEIEENTIVFVEWGEKLPSDVFEGIKKVVCRIERLKSENAESNTGDVPEPRRIICESI